VGAIGVLTKPIKKTKEASTRPSAASPPSPSAESAPLSLSKPDQTNRSAMKRSRAATMSETVQVDSPTLPSKRFPIAAFDIIVNSIDLPGRKALISSMKFASAPSSAMSR